MRGRKEVVGSENMYRLWMGRTVYLENGKGRRVLKDQKGREEGVRKRNSQRGCKEERSIGLREKEWDDVSKG